NNFLDFAAGIAVCSTGHCHPKVVAAIQKQAAELIHMSGTDFYYEGMPQLAERLGRTMPGAESKKVFFTNSGTEAIEGAIKLARYATKRDKMIAFYGCFHGRSMGALSLTASKSTQRKGFGALLSGIEHIPYPYAYRCAHRHTQETCGVEILEQLEGQIFKRLFDPEDVAGIIIEPSESGYVENARRMGDYRFGRLADWTKNFKIVGDVRGRGLMIGVEIVRDQRTKEKAADLRNAIVDLAFHKGLLVLGAGENTIRLSPPLLIDEEQADFAVRTLEDCFREAEKKA